jgi:VCBS repeat-containing protein
VYDVGSEAILKCLVVDSGATTTAKVAEMNWFKNGIKIDNSGKYRIYTNGTLTIGNVAASDAGRYSCRVSSNDSHTTKTVVVKITGKNI